MICHWLVLNDIFNVDVCYLCKNSFEAATYSGGIKKKKYSKSKLCCYWVKWCLDIQNTQCSVCAYMYVSDLLRCVSMRLMG